MPTPNPNESKDKFIPRCIKFMAKEKPDMPNDQRIAVCESIYREHKKKKEEEAKKEDEAFKANMDGFSKAVANEFTRKDIGESEFWYKRPGQKDTK